MRFLERNIPAEHRKVVDAFKRTIQEACEHVALARTTVEIKSDGERECVVFTLFDALGGAATVECAMFEPPKQVGRRAYRAAGKMIYGTAVR